jgi:NAD(P)-dependent dehydrogenase (short-subunit alcohol dehydrogenase family)
MARIALVTGANRGIGREVARQLAVRGDTVVLTARDQARAERAAAELGADGAVQVAPLPRRLDVTDPVGVQRVADDLTVVREALETNLLGAWRITLALLPLLRTGGHGRIGKSGMNRLPVSGQTGNPWWARATPISYANGSTAGWASSRLDLDRGRGCTPKWERQANSANYFLWSMSPDRGMAVSYPGLRDSPTFRWSEPSELFSTVRRG